MNAQAQHNRGRPLVFFGMLVAIWLAGRLAFLSLSGADGSRPSEPTRQLPVQSLASVKSAPVAADPTHTETMSARPLPSRGVDGLDPPPLPHMVPPTPLNAGAAHNLLWMEAAHTVADAEPVMETMLVESRPQIAAD